MENEPARRRKTHAATTYQAFLKDLDRLAGLPKDLVERATVAVLSALEQSMRPEESRKLESQLPSTVRELLAQVYVVRPRRFGCAEFLWRVGLELGTEPAETEVLTRAVLRAVQERISEGEARKVAAELPAELAELWLNP